MGSANGGRFGTVSHSQWSSGRATAPANPNICTVGWSMWRASFFFVLRVSLTPLTDLLILNLHSFSSSLVIFFFCSLRLGYLVRYTVCCSLLESLPCFAFLFALVFFCPSVLLPVLDTGGDLGRRYSGGGTREDGWMGGSDSSLSSRLVLDSTYHGTAIAAQSSFSTKRLTVWFFSHSRDRSIVGLLMGLIRLAGRFFTATSPYQNAHLHYLIQVDTGSLSCLVC
ncbi:hypothetical protein N658DRAFT_7772 [Parathielavia hyrcaniae]|uniref:Transmembrane protein n=1 Tax=Parathielavia hyrcaniae TaxID=113614 RepID=A0AAN6QET4_9PEZI|nr:hypothetical protein N658DRAFT_7772 [Parathielavia hyrcaniae]